MLSKVKKKRRAILRKSHKDLLKYQGKEKILSKRFQRGENRSHTKAQKSVHQSFHGHHWLLMEPDLLIFKEKLFSTYNSIPS